MAFGAPVLRSALKSRARGHLPNQEAADRLGTEPKSIWRKWLETCPPTGPAPLKAELSQRLEWLEER